jgi:hypothetical protein
MTALPVDPVAASRTRRASGEDRPVHEPAEGGRGFEGHMRSATEQPARRGEELRVAQESGPLPGEGVMPLPSEGAVQPCRPPGASASPEPTPRPSRSRVPAGTEATADALRQAAMAAAGLGTRPPPPRPGPTVPPAGSGQDGSGQLGPSASAVAGPGSEDGAGSTLAGEEPRRPLNEAVHVVPGRREFVLPSSSTPDPSAAAAQAAKTRVTPAGPTGQVDVARATAISAADGSGVDGAILRSAAHLRIEGVPGGLGEVELHLRIRGDVTLLRVEGAGAQVVGMREPELAASLAAAGLSLGRLDVPPVPTASGAQTSGGGSHHAGAGSGGSQTPSNGQPEPQDRGTARPAPDPRNESPRGGGNPPRGTRVHVEA